MRFVYAACAAIGFGSMAPAQFTTSGTPVGSSFNLAGVSPVGAKTTSAMGAPFGQVGSGVGGVAPVASQDFRNIDPKQLAAPMPVYPGIGTTPTLWDRAKQKTLAVVNYFNPFTPPTVPRPNWVPGISRRNRERGMERRSTPLD